MNLALSTEQLDLGLSVRDVLTKEFELADLMDPVRTRTKASSLWTLAADLGWLSIGLPLDIGGLGLGLTEQVVVCQELGRRAGAGPLRRDDRGGAARGGGRRAGVGGSARGRFGEGRLSRGRPCRRRRSSEPPRRGQLGRRTPSLDHLVRGGRGGRSGLCAGAGGPGRPRGQRRGWGRARHCTGTDCRAAFRHLRSGDGNVRRVRRNTRANSGVLSAATKPSNIAAPIWRS